MAVLYDGRSAVAHPVMLQAAGTCLVIRRDGMPDETLPIDQLTVVERDAGGLVLARPAVDGWRLRIAAPVPVDLAALLPRRAVYGRWVDRIGLWPAAAGFALVSAALLALAHFAPSALAPMVPAAAERAYGNALVGDLGGRYCTSPAGDAALGALVARLDPQADDLKVRIVDLPLVNAAALPGGTVVLFDGLLQQVATPDELAGVLAHEIAHVRRRHVTAAMIRQLGIGTVIAMLGGSTGGNVDGFLSLGFSRRAETEADGDAIARLQRAAISPARTAAFFRRLDMGEGTARLDPALAYISSHPLSAERAARFEQAARQAAGYRPALSARQWAALRGTCTGQAG